MRRGPEGVQGGGQSLCGGVTVNTSHCTSVQTWGWTPPRGNPCMTCGLWRLGCVRVGFSSCSEHTALMGLLTVGEPGCAFRLILL